MWHFQIDRLLLGEIDPSWRTLTDDETAFNLAQLRDTDLVRNCTYLTADLAFQFAWVDLIDPGNPVCFSGWEKRACRSAHCPDNASCPLHINMPQRVPNDLLDVLGKVIAKSCLKMETNIGRTYRVAKYDKLLKRFHISSEDRGRQLLDHLGMRGFVIGYQWAGYGEGIHGWLDPDETRELYDFLDSLPLPRYEDTIEGLETFDRIPVEQRQIGFSFEEENLACVRTLAAIASNEQKGMLWGNDLLGYEDD